MSGASDDEMAGGPIHRYGEPTGDDSLSGGDGELIDAVTAHVEQHVGPVGTVFHEILSPYVHVDVHHVAPARGRDYHVLFTTGMAERPMATPPEMAEYEYAELVVCLPGSWPISEQAFEDEANYWPVRWLKILARFPHQYDTWLGWGHSMPNGDPPEPIANTGFCGVLLLPPLTFPDAARRVELAPGRTVHLWSVVPLYREEMELKLRDGTSALTDLFDERGVNEIIDINRPNAAVKPKRRFWPF